MNQSILDDFVRETKKKYKNIIESLKLEYINETGNVHIYLVLIKIKKSQRDQGYGNAIMSDLIQLADMHQVKISLWPTNFYGANLKRLYGFYKKHGFVRVRIKNPSEMIYYPKKKSNMKE